MKPLLLAWLCLFVLVHTGTVAGSDEVPTYNANGVVCHMCPPGTYVKEHCTENFTNSTCLTCRDHEFMEVWNDLPHCKLCVPGSCPKNGKEVTACTHTTNRLCRCRAGFYGYPIDPYDPHFKCYSHKQCKAGHGIVSYGNHSHDTECKKCLVGHQFVNASDNDRPRCQECSVCPLGVQMVTECNLTDTVCDNSTQTNATTPDPLHGDGGSGDLDGGHIVLIVLCILVPIAIVGFIIIYWKRTQIRTYFSSPPPRPNQDVENVEDLDNGYAGVGVPLVELEENPWTDKTIDRKVFPYLSQQLGDEWRHVILQLPGWPKGFNVQATIEQKIEEEASVQNRILGCLVAWKKAVPPNYFCKASIMDTLRTMEKAELVQSLEMISMESVSNGHS